MSTFVNAEGPAPRILTLCGSSRFPEAFHIANAHFSMRGDIVISLGLFGHADQPTGARFLTSDGDESTPEKTALDHLHFRKIDLADAIFVVNVGGYIGSSTKREIAYAQSKGKGVEYMFPRAGIEETHEPETLAVLKDALVYVEREAAMLDDVGLLDEQSNTKDLLDALRAAIAKADGL